MHLRNVNMIVDLRLYIYFNFLMVEDNTYGWL